MKTLKIITILLLFVSQLNAQRFTQHTLVDCKKENCFKKHKVVTVDYDSLSGLKLVKTTYSSGKNLDAFTGLTPKKKKSTQEVVTSNGKRLKTYNSVTKYRGDATRGSGNYVSFDDQAPGFYVYHAPKLFGAAYTERYDAGGNFIEKK